ncbi:MAG: triose-phosphate isomerase [Aquisalimonadaceae bacterium]
MRQPLVAGNWKMHGTRRSVCDLADAVAAGAADVGDVHVAVAPPSIYIAPVAERLKGSAVSLGAQNLCDQDEGARTGEISAPMLREYGCAFAIVGHSERRQYYGESDALVAARTAAALRGGLMPILCVGETLPEREAGQAEAVVVRQLRAVAGLVGVDGLAGTVIAYEPVWAIGTGLSATPEQAQAMHALIRDTLRLQHRELASTVRILYGGSVKPDNAAALFAMPDINGGLIGGAALNADMFLAICRAAAKSGAAPQERT